MHFFICFCVHLLSARNPLSDAYQKALDIASTKTTVLANTDVGPVIKLANPFRDVSIARKKTLRLWNADKKLALKHFFHIDLDKKQFAGVDLNKVEIEFDVKSNLFKVNVNNSVYWSSGDLDRNMYPLGKESNLLDKKVVPRDRVLKFGEGFYVNADEFVAALRRNRVSEKKIQEILETLTAKKGIVKRDGDKFKAYFEVYDEKAGKRNLIIIALIPLAVAGLWAVNEVTSQ